MERLDAIRARAEAATYCGGDMQELADDALALLDEVERLRSQVRGQREAADAAMMSERGRSLDAEAEVERLRSERDQAREECGHEKHMRKFVSDERDNFIAAKMRAEAERDDLAAALSRVRELADEANEWRPVVSRDEGECFPAVVVDDLIENIRAAIEGTDS